jgi:hypothetical protein
MATGPNRQVKPSEIDLDQLVVQFRPVVGFKVKKSLGGGNPDWEDVTNEILMQVIEKVRTGEFRGQSGSSTISGRRRGSSGGRPRAAAFPTLTISSNMMRGRSVWPKPSGA